MDDHDEDDDTVIGNCLHCNAPPPPRSSEDSVPDSAATRVQVSCDDCRSFICDGAYLTVYYTFINAYTSLLFNIMWTCKKQLISLSAFAHHRCSTHFCTYLPNHHYYYYQDAIGVMNFRQITKLGFAIDVTPFIVGGVMKWINVRTVVKLFVTRVQH